MALVISDRVKETTTTSGTGTYTLGGAITGFETFTVNLSDGDTTYYACTDNTDFEVGLGTFTASGTTLARTTILASSNSGSAVDWAAGTRTIFCTLPAAKAVFLDASGNTTISGSVTADSFVIGNANINENDLESIDDVTAGTISASKAAVVDVNKDITGFRNVTLTGELDAATLDISGNADIDGTLEADAMTLNGVAITTTATLSTGISNGNVLVADSTVSDDDFLRINGTSVEGRSASEVASDIGAIAADSTTTLTNKTIDVDNNTISNIEVDNLKSGVLDTDLSTVSASDDTLASAKAIKTYVDAQVTAQDLDFQGDTGGALNIDLDSEVLDIAGGTGIDTSGSGNTLTVAIDSTVATLSGTQTLTNKSIDASQLTGTVANTRLDAQLQDVAGLAVSDGNFIVGDGANFVAESGATARTSLGLGTSATLDVGTSANNVVQLDGSARLPAVDGSQLTNITVTETDPSALAFAIALG